MSFIKENWFKLFIVVVTITIIGFYSYQEFKPKSNQEKIFDCLKLNSDFGAETCVKLVIEAAKKSKQ